MTSTMGCFQTKCTSDGRVGNEQKRQKSDKKMEKDLLNQQEELERENKTEFNVEEKQKENNKHTRYLFRTSHGQCPCRCKIFFKKY